GCPGGFTSAVIAGSAVMGRIIPPSVALVVFAYVCGGGISVGELFLMGIIPGVLIGLTMMALVAIQARRRNFPVSGERFSVRRVLRALRGATLGLVVPAIIIGGILGGVFTPTEAGAVAAAYGVLIGMFVLRTLSLSDLKKRSEEHTSELQSRFDLVCRLLLEKKKKTLTKPKTIITST